MGLGTSRGARRVVVGAREAVGGAAAQARSRGSATTEGSVNGLNPRPRYPPGTRPVRVLSACGGLNPRPLGARSAITVGCFPRAAASTPAPGTRPVA